TNTVSIFPGSLAAMLPFRADLERSRSWLRALFLPSLAGGSRERSSCSRRRRRCSCGSCPH
ncbi:MAG: hypothetical protein ACKOCT_21645, partial [Alphaproteobacteria bacterium]